eukprot:Hpha_TRINITY_DN34630_c0_g1::TRINITY_DN34630_c0_g1_i1::g.21014::m.21014
MAQANRGRGQSASQQRATGRPPTAPIAAPSALSVPPVGGLSPGTGMPVSPASPLSPAPPTQQPESPRPAPRPANVWNLTYEPRGNFSNRVAEDFAHSHHVATPGLRRPETAGCKTHTSASLAPTSPRAMPYRPEVRAQQAPRPGAPSTSVSSLPVDVGDMVRAWIRPEDGKPPLPGIGKVVERRGDDPKMKVEVMWKRQTPAGVEVVRSVLEMHESDLERLPPLLSAWCPSDTGGLPLKPSPAITHQRERGLAPGDEWDSFKNAERRANLRWQEFALKPYLGTNMELLATVLAKAASGSGGLIYKRKLQDCLEKLDALPPDEADDLPPDTGNDTYRPEDLLLSAGARPVTRNTKEKVMEKILSVFGRGDLRGDRIPETELRKDPLMRDVEVVVYDDFLAAIDSVVNSEDASDRFVVTCFSRYASSDCIHKGDLLEARRLRRQDAVAQRASGFNHTQVNALLKVFDEMLVEAEAEFVNSSSSGKKKKKKKKPPPRPPGRMMPGEWNGTLPKWYHVPKHMDQATFRRYLSKDCNLVIAFLPVCIDELYMRKAAARGNAASKFPLPALRARRWSDTHETPTFMTEPRREFS